jgi:hypothetical protein
MSKKINRWFETRIHNSQKALLAHLQNCLRRSNTNIAMPYTSSMWNTLSSNLDSTKHLPFQCHKSVVNDTVMHLDSILATRNEKCEIHCQK